VAEKLRRIVHAHALSLTKHHDSISIFFQDKNSSKRTFYKEYIGYGRKWKGTSRKSLNKYGGGDLQEADVTLLFFGVLGMCTG